MRVFGNKADLSHKLIIVMLTGWLFYFTGCSQSSFFRSNDLLVANGESEKAISNYKNALAEDAENHKLYYYLAKAYYSAGNYDQAENEINKAILLEPQIDHYRLLAGKIAYSLTNYFNATNHLINALLLNDTSLEAYYFLALAYQQTGNGEQALVQLEIAIALEPLYFNAQYLWHKLTFEELIVASRQEGEKTETETEADSIETEISIEESIGDLITTFSQVLKSNPKSVSGTVLLSRMYSAVGETARAQSVLSDWIKEFGYIPESIPFELAKQKYENGLFDQSLAVLNQIDNPSIEARILKLRLMQKIHPKGSFEDQIKELMTESAEAIEILLLAGQSEYAKGNQAEAEALLQRCIDKDPRFAACYFELSEVLSDQRDEIGSQWALNKAFELSPFDNEIRLQYARRLIESERFNAANTVLAHGSLRENDPKVAFLKGIIAKEQKEYKKAESLFSFARRYSYAVEIEVEFADMEIRQGKFQLAESRLKKIESIAPGHLEIALMKAKLFDATGRTSQVPGVLGVQLSATAGRGRVHLALANAYARMGDLKKSLEILEQGLKIRPRNLELTQAITFYLGLTEQYQRAIEILEDIQAFKHKYNELFHYRLWMYYYKSGKTAQFKAYRKNN